MTETGNGRGIFLARMNITSGSLAIAASLSILEAFTWRVQMDGAIIPPQHFGSVNVTCVSGVIQLFINRQPHNLLWQF